MSFTESQDWSPIARAQELRIRALRDRVFESVSTDANWLGCRNGWMTPDGVRWLEEWAGKMTVKELTT